MRRPSMSCQVEGCTADLSSLRPYFQRQHICEEHARADEIPDGRGGYLRFCQQCTKLEPLAAFDGKKRSCQTSLVKRHHRRSGGSKRSYGGARTASSSGYHQQLAAASRAAAAAEERSATSQQLTGTTRSGSASREYPADTAARSLAALVDAALPDEDEPAAAPAAAPALPPALLPGGDMGPSLASYDVRGSGILDGHPPALAATVPRHLGFGNIAAPPPFAAPPSAVPAWGTLAPEIQAALLGAGGPAAPVAVQPEVGHAAHKDLAPLLASMLSSRASQEPTATALGGGPVPLRGTGSTEVHQQASGLGAAPAPASQGEDDQKDLQQLLTALQLLQQLQQMISGVVVAQLQQHLARQEAASLLEQRLLPLLGSIQAHLAPRGDASSASQLSQLLHSLNQLAGMLQPPPQQQDQQVLQLLQWLQQAGALGGVPTPAAPTPPPLADAGQDDDQVQAMLRRVAGLLKRTEDMQA